MAVRRWNVEVHSSGVYADLTPRIRSLSISQKRNAADTIQIELDLDDTLAYLKSINTSVKTLFATNVAELHIYLGDRKISAGQIASRDVRVSESRRSITLRAYGFFALLKYRTTGSLVNYTATDAGAIAWDLINTTQVASYGALGITMGTITTSVSRTRGYSYKNVKEAIEELSAVENGFDFEVTPDKVFNVYYPKMGIKRDDVTFTYPGTIVELSDLEDGTRMANRVLAFGAGTGDFNISTSVEDTALETVYTRRDAKVNRSDVSDVTTLTSHANGLLSAQKNVLHMPQLTVDGNREPRFGSYGLGDEVQIVTDRYQEVFADINGYWRIDGMDINVDENAREQVRLLLLR